MRLLIDGSYLCYRSYSCPHKFQTATGLDSTMIYIFFKSLHKLEREFKPEEVIIAWEGGLSWRRELLKTYKPPREPNPEFISQRTDLRGMLTHLNYQQFFSLKNEADDVIATLVTDENYCGLPANIFTVDKDIMQLIRDSIPIQIIDNKHKTIKEKDVKEKFGVSPNQIPDFLALTGDASDNIKGIPKIGPKTASKLLAKYKSLDHVPLTREQRKKASLNRKLTRLNKNCDLQEYSPSPVPLDEYIKKYELKDLRRN